LLLAEAPGQRAADGKRDKGADASACRGIAVTGTAAEASGSDKRVKDRSAQLSATASHVTVFAEMMTGRHGERLPEWITAVDAVDLPHLHSFTRGIRRDQAAVVNGLTLAHSSGAVEGNVCRVKALKRQMFGRANLDLLRKRTLLST
jgi:transposase